LKILGIIGGIAPASTIEYYRMLIAAYQARRPDGSQPLVIINSIDLQTMIGLIAADALDPCDADQRRTLLRRMIREIDEPLRRLDRIVLLAAPELDVGEPQ